MVFQSPNKLFKLCIAENKNIYASTYIYTEVFTQYFLNDSSLWCIVSLYKTYCTSGFIYLFSCFHQLCEPMQFWTASKSSSKSKCTAFVLGYRAATWVPCEILRGFSSNSVQGKQFCAWKAWSGGKIGVGHVWDYHTCQHTFKKISTSSCSLMLCVTY